MRLIALVCVALAFAAAPLSGIAQGVPAAVKEQPPLSQPVVEVAVFRVAPVASGGQDTRARRNAAETGTSAGRPPAPSERSIEVRAQKGERWPDLLARLSASLSVKSPLDVLELRNDALPQLQPGKYLRARAPADDRLEIDYVINPNEGYALTINGAAMQVRPLVGDARLIERMRADPAKASLFTATDAVGLPENIALQLTEIFAGEVDFLRELHLGYRCAIVYEAHYREGFIEPSGRILAVELEVGNRRYGAYYAQDTRGRGAYFDSNGKHTRRLFRRSPLEFTRITSDYTLARFHPILGVWTAHRGVDYAAPTGTRIKSVADGVVEYAAPRGGYGNLVIVRHQDKFQTYYAHMNGFAPNLAVGSRVAQGDTLGFVGMTGLATGPHLHFEFHIRGASGEWTSVPAPDVMDASLSAAPGFAQKVQAYRDSLAAADQGNILILE